jgi:hypothetical protein
VSLGKGKERRGEIGGKDIDCLEGLGLYIGDYFTKESVSGCTCGF